MADKERRIQLDNKYVLCSDRYCWWVESRITAEDKAPRYARCSGYHSTFTEAIDSCIEKRLMTADVNTLEELRREVAKIKKDVRTWKNLLKTISQGDKFP